MVLPQRSESRQPRICSLSTPVALNSKGGVETQTEDQKMTNSKTDAIVRHRFLPSAVSVSPCPFNRLMLCYLKPDRLTLEM